MPLVVRSNLASLSAARHLSQTQVDLGRSLARISSGKRVVSAADDAAGLAVSTNLTTQARSLRVGMRNANDGISMIQTAEGAQNQVTDIMQRMRELAVQSASETLNDDERQYLQTEYQEMLEQVGQVVQSTEFNGIALADGTVTQVSVQVGINNASSSRISISLENMTDVHALLSTTTVQDAGQSLLAMGSLDVALDSVNSARSQLGASQNRLESAISASEVSHESLVAAASQIEDVDYARETAEMVRLQIQSQAGVAALAQSKELSRMAVNLLL